MEHRTIREGDEYACACGLRWGIDEEDPHSFIESFSVHFDFAKPGSDRTVVNGHVLYKDSDFTAAERERNNQLANAVITGGLDVCMQCGEYESGLDAPCKNGVV